MTEFDAMMRWWAEREVIVPSGDADTTIAWLSTQTPDVWHCVAATWNYDSGDRVIAWILAQPECDQGTAARIFYALGDSNWLWEVVAQSELAQDESHLCHVILQNWDGYAKTGLKRDWTFSESLMDKMNAAGKAGVLGHPALWAILNYEGHGEPESIYQSDDGKVVHSLAYWAAQNGIVID